MDEKQIDALLNKMSEACDGHSTGDILTVMAAIVASILEGMEFEKGVPLVFSMAMMAIQSAYDIDPENFSVDQYLQ